MIQANTNNLDEMIEVNTSNLNEMIQLMDRNKEFDEDLFGTNENGEYVQIGVYKNFLTIRTLQSNGWERTNIYYRDGSSEELYERSGR